jgi:ectoine hydroxylase-related dioxygenase (phytanoyl-CoA dioxygenase family)
VLRLEVGEGALQELRDSVFRADRPGQRCLLDSDVVQATVRAVRDQLIARGTLRTGAVAIQAIAFDKTASQNWKVTWHQDVMFPFASPPHAPGFDQTCVKEGVCYARPPRAVLEEMLAVRFHLDPCDDTNGPLRVASGSHVHGILRSSEVHRIAKSCPQQTILADVSDALLMRPLLLHASSVATAPRHRRVLHLVFHAGAPMPEAWHRRV